MQQIVRAFKRHAVGINKFNVSHKTRNSERTAEIFVAYVTDSLEQTLAKLSSQFS